MLNLFNKLRGQFQPEVEPFSIKSVELGSYQAFFKSIDDALAKGNSQEVLDCFYGGFEKEELSIILGIVAARSFPISYNHLDIGDLMRWFDNHGNSIHPHLGVAKGKIYRLMSDHHKMFLIESKNQTSPELSDSDLFLPNPYFVRLK